MSPIEFVNTTLQIWIFLVLILIAKSVHEYAYAKIGAAEKFKKFIGIVYNWEFFVFQNICIVSFYIVGLIVQTFVKDSPPAFQLIAFASIVIPIVLLVFVWIVFAIIQVLEKIGKNITKFRQVQIKKKRGQ